MNFSEPAYLHSLWLLLPVMLLFLYIEKRGKRLSGNGKSSTSLLGELFREGRGRRYLKYTLQTTGLIFVLFAIAGPRWGMKEEIIERRGIDIVIALDLSKSMLAADILPSRIERARIELASFIDSRRGDRIGIVAFAGSAVVACPLTMDYGAAKNFLRGLEPGLLPSPGTDLSGAIDVSVKLLQGYAGREKVVLLLTDGEDTLGDPVKAAAAALKNGVSLYTIGFGTEKGAPIPVFDEKGKVADYRKDWSGKTVISRLEGSSLKEIASAGGGASFQGGAALQQLKTELDKKDKSVIASKIFTLMEERFQYPLFIAILFFVAEILVPGRRRLS
jgi:Ca-activated chloride channel homolog